MNFKVFAALFVALVAVHASSQSPLQDDSTKDIVVSVLDGILEVTGAALKTANGLIESFEADQDEIKNKIVARVVSQGKTLNSLLVALIDQLNEGATPDGKEVLACIDAQQDKTDAAIEQAATDAGNCLAAETDIVLVKVKSILSQLNDLQDDVQGQADTLSACSGSDLTCLLGFASTASATLKKIPTIVQNDIQEIFELVKVIVVDLGTCDVQTNIKANAQEIFNDVVVCIKQ